MTKATMTKATMTKATTGAVGAAEERAREQAVAIPSSEAGGDSRLSSRRFEKILQRGSLWHGLWQCQFVSLKTRLASCQGVPNGAVHIDTCESTESLKRPDVHEEAQPAAAAHGAHFGQPAALICAQCWTQHFS